MRKDTFKLLVLAAIVAFAILYGMELASSGISTVYGPLDTPPAAQRPAATTDDWTLPARQPQPSQAVNGPVYPWSGDGTFVIPRNDRKPIVDRVSGATAEALHDVSSGGIRFIVSLFDRLTGS